MISGGVSHGLKGFGHGVLNAGCACTGPMRNTPATGWNDLPYELVDLILDNLSCTELAIIAWTCRAFQSAFRNGLAREQARRCALAIACFGRERIDRIAELIAPSLRGGTLDLKPDGHLLEDFWISRDGKFHDRYANNGVARDPVEVYVMATEQRVDIKLVLPNASHILLLARPHCKMVIISMHPCNDDDLVGVGLLQSLLGRSVPPIPGPVGPYLDVRLWGGFWEGRMSQPGFRTQLAPLLPFASQHLSTFRGGVPPVVLGESIKIECGCLKMMQK
jgi:hypothetical protein